MNWKDAAASGSSQILLEGDMIVPDSKPDLQEILRCQGNVKIREKRVTDDRISFSGDLEISVLYRAKNGERPLYAMQASLPLEDFLHIDGLEKDMETSLDAVPEHLDCQIINDRKIGVKAVLGVTATGERQNHTEILSGISGEGIECLQGILRMEQNTAPLKDRFTVKEEITLPSAKPEIADVLWQTIDLTEQDIRAMDGKVMVRGYLRICMLYCDTEGNLGSFCEKIPFSGYLEGEGIEPKTELTGTLQIEDAKLTPTVDEDGEARQLAVDVAVSAALQGRETVEREILQDAYAPAGTVTLEKETVTYPVTVGSGKNQFFGQMMELRGVAEGDAAAVQLRLDDLDFQMLSEQEGELRAAVTMEAVVLRDETAEIVKDITPEEEAAPSPMAGAVIYMVQPGDTLWKIAKRYRTTVENILAVNEIENPDLIYPGQKLLIIKQIH